MIIFVLETKEEFSSVNPIPPPTMFWTVPPFIVMLDEAKFLPFPAPKIVTLFGTIWLPFSQDTTILSFSSDTIIGVPFA